MKHIFFITGPTGSGKDTIMKTLFKDYLNDSNKYKPLYRYTSRPRRNNSDDYYIYTDNDTINIANANKEVIEIESYIVNEYTNERWMYCTLKSQLDLDKYNYIATGSLNLYNNLNMYFNKEKVLIPIYIDCEARTRLERSLSRAGYSDKDIYEVCRRIYSDSIQFSQEKIKEINPVCINNNDNGYINTKRICQTILKYISSYSN